MPNNTLKTSSHSGYIASYADWSLPAGIGRFGGTATLDCQLPGVIVLPSRTLYVGFICAKSNAYVVFPNSAYIYAGFWLNNGGASYWIQGTNPFTLDGAIQGAVTPGTPREYKIFARTDRSTSFLSTALSLADAPTDANFAAGTTVSLTWDRLGDVGIISYDVYRKTGSTYTLLAEVESGANTYLDNNTQEMNTTSYPTPTDDRSIAYTSTRILTTESVLDTMAVNGVSAQWSTIIFPIPVPYDYNAGSPAISGDTGLQWLRIGIGGLTGAYADLDLPSVIVTGGVNVSASYELFTVDMVGLSVSFDTVPAGTIAAFVDNDHITLTTPFDNGTYEMYITGGAGPHCILIDAVHQTYAAGATFSNNPQDLTPPRPQFPRATPNGSSQGGTGSGGGNDGGGPHCIEINEPVLTLYGNQVMEKRAGDLKVGDVLESGNIQPNIITQIQYSYCPDLWQIKTENGCVLKASPSHPIYRNRLDKHGTPIEMLKVNNKVLTCINGTYSQSKIICVEATGDRGDIVRISCSPSPSFVASGIVSHNRKPEGGG